MMEEKGNAAYLTMLVVGVSSRGPDGNVLLSAQGQAIGRYAMDHLPISWKKDTQAFGMKKGWQEFDWETASVEMSAVRWDYYKKVPADNAFEVEKAWKEVAAKIKKILRDTPQSDRTKPAYQNAELVAKQFALEA
jgi:hypothetical protein